MRTCRQCFTALAVLIWCWTAYRYRDLNYIDNSILLEIQHEIAEIKASMLAYFI